MEKLWTVTITSPSPSPAHSVSHTMTHTLSISQSLHPPPPSKTTFSSLQGKQVEYEVWIGFKFKTLQAQSSYQRL